MSPVNRSWRRRVSTRNMAPDPRPSMSSSRAIERCPEKMPRVAAMAALARATGSVSASTTRTTLRDQSVRGGVQQLHEDRLLGREVEVDAALGGVRLAGDIVHGGFAIAGPAEDMERRIQDALAPLPCPFVVRGACLAVHTSPSARTARPRAAPNHKPTDQSVGCGAMVARPQGPPDRPASPQHHATATVCGCVCLYDRSTPGSDAYDGLGTHRTRKLAMTDPTGAPAADAGAAPSQRPSQPDKATALAAAPWTRVLHGSGALPGGWCSPRASSAWSSGSCCCSRTWARICAIELLGLLLLVTSLLSVYQLFRGQSSPPASRWFVPVWCRRDDRRAGAHRRRCHRLQRPGHPSTRGRAGCRPRAVRPRRPGVGILQRRPVRVCRSRRSSSRLVRTRRTAADDQWHRRL